CELTTYYRSMTLFEKLKHCKDFKTTTQYLKNAASGHANSSDRKVKAAAEFVLSKNNKNLAKVTPASEQAITTLAMAEGATQGAATVRTRAVAIGKTPKSRRAQRDKLRKKLRQAPAHQPAANTAAVAPLELQQERDFAANVAETNRVIAALDSPGDFA